MKYLATIAVTLLLVCFSVGYELKLDTVGDAKLWVFSGHYFYTPKVEDIEGFFPALTPNHLRLTSAREKPTESSPGIWFTKHISGRRNVFQVSYRLTHALFMQGWIKFLSDSSITLVVKDGNNHDLGSFYSDGKSWCDAIFKVDGSSVIVEAETPEQNDYILIDKIIMGVAANISQLQSPRRLNPCRQRRSFSRDSEEDDSEENKRTGRMNLKESELESGERGRPNLSTSTTAPEGADATLEELEKFLEQEEPRSVSTSTLTSTSSTVQGRVRSGSAGRDGGGTPDLHTLPTNLGLRRKGANSTEIEASDANVDCNCSCSCFKRST